MSANTFFHMECGIDERFSLVFGPFDYVQLTYAVLTVGPGGVEVGYFGTDGFWHFCPDWDPPEGKNAFGGNPGDLRDRYSDVVIHGEVEKC